MSMSKTRPGSDAQTTIFDLLKEPDAASRKAEGSFCVVCQLRAALRDAIKKSQLSVHQLAGEISHLLGCTITAEQIYSWTRVSDEKNGRPGRHVPAEYLPAFCRATGSREPLRVLGDLLGVFVLPGPEALRAEIQRLDEDIRKAKRQKQKRQVFLAELERR